MMSLLGIRGQMVASPAVLMAGAFVAAAPAVAVSSAASSWRAAAAIGTFAVGRVERTFVDDSRPTKANGTYAGAPDRTLHTTIYYPAPGEPPDAGTPDAPADRQRDPY